MGWGLAVVTVTFCDAGDQTYDLMCIREALYCQTILSAPLHSSFYFSSQYWGFDLWLVLAYTLSLSCISALCFCLLLMTLQCQKVTRMFSHNWSIAKLIMYQSGSIFGRELLTFVLKHWVILPSPFLENVQYKFKRQRTLCMWCL